MTIITSKANNGIKKAKKLLQKKHRTDSYLIEGWHLFEEAQKAGVDFKKIFVLADQSERLDQTLPVIKVTPEVLKELTDSPVPQGIIAEVAITKKTKQELSKGSYLILEDIQDPGNVGTMIRTADAAGLSGVIISEKSADIYNQKTLRSMQGSHFHLPIWRMNLDQAYEQFRELAIPILATTLSSESKDYKEVDQYENFALVMGNEGQGISSRTVKQADVLVHIDMPGDAESLNVAVAAGIVLFRLI